MVNGTVVNQFMVNMTVDKDQLMVNSTGDS